MDAKLEQRANIKFCVKLGKSPTETHEMLEQAYGNEAMSRARCFEWHSHFRKDRAPLGDEERPARPHTCNTPDLGPCASLLFPKVKLERKGRRPGTVEDTQRESPQKVLDRLEECDFQEAFQKWKRRWDRCAVAQGDYFEGEGSQI